MPVPRRPQVVPHGSSTGVAGGSDLGFYRGPRPSGSGPDLTGGSPRLSDPAGSSLDVIRSSEGRPVSLTRRRAYGAAPVGNSRAGAADAQFDRTPPQDVEPPSSRVLGGMLLSKDAIADVVEILRPGDFYRPAQPADLRRDPRHLRPRRTGRPDHRRGRARPHRRAGPDRRRALPAHADRHACPPQPTPATTPRSSAERAVLRRLVEAGTRIVQMGYGTGRAAAGTSTTSSTWRSRRGLRGDREAGQRGFRRPRPTCCSRRWTRSRRWVHRAG